MSKPQTNKPQSVFDRHHIIPRSRGGSDDTNNLIRILRTRHEDLHRLFWNKTPDEQIEQLLKMYDTARTKTFRKDLFDVLSSHQDNYFKEEVWKP